MRRSTLLLLYVAVAGAQLIRQSIPFDPYRLECQYRMAMTELTMRHVVSSGEQLDCLCQSLCSLQHLIVWI